MGRKQEKGKKGEAVEYYSRKQALRHLQISLPNFIRLCLWKSIYPSQPNNLKKAGKGDTRPKIYYRRKDINLLIHEPIVGKLREIRAFNLKLRRAKERKDRDRIYRLRKRKPRYTLHHMVRELYPTPEDAVRGLDDCLRSVFVFATLPTLSQFNGSYITLCRRLKLEFLNLCIRQRSIRRCFISVKGFYVEVDLLGHPVRWLMPHQHTSTNLPSSCDYRLLANQMEFDCTMLASLLKHLYTKDGLMYPPKFVTEQSETGTELKQSEILASLAFPLATVSVEEMEERLSKLNQFRDMDPDIATAADKETKIAAIQTLFEGKKVFLNREVPREIFCFLLRGCGASVSWETASGTCAAFPATDSDIDFHVIDRPVDGMESNVNRFYVQPQFVFDSINAGRLLPVRDYLPGMKLIPHLSPFADYTKGYVPPEYRYLQGEIDADELHHVDDDDEENEELENDEMEEDQDELVESDDDEDEDDDDDEEDDDVDDADEEEEEEEEVAVDERDYDSDENMDYEEGEQKEKSRKQKKIKKEEKPVVKNQPKSTGSKTMRKSKEEYLKEIQANKELKLREMSLPKKRLNLYKKMKHAEKREKSNVEKLKQKREDINRKRKLTNK